MADTEVVPIRVVIGLRPNGHADHPDWKQLPSYNTERKVRNAQIVKWKYDKTSGHADTSVGSPKGQQLGMLMVTPAFAAEALVAFPAIVTRMTEAEAETFWDDKAHRHLPRNRADNGTLEALDIELRLRTAIGADLTAIHARIAKALDPLDDTEPGFRRNRLKKWADAKVKLKLTVVEP